MAAAADSSKTIYVGGFSYETNAQLIHSAFIPFGEIVDIQLPGDPAKRGTHKGFAFVSYSTAESAYDAIDNMNRNVLPGPSNVSRVLKVNLAQAPKGGIKKGGGNRAIWADEEWLKEHGQGPAEPKQIGQDLEQDDE